MDKLGPRQRAARLPRRLGLLLACTPRQLPCSAVAPQQLPYSPRPACCRCCCARGRASAALQCCCRAACSRAPGPHSKCCVPRCTTLLATIFCWQSQCNRTNAAFGLHLGYSHQHPLRRCAGPCLLCVGFCQTSCSPAIFWAGCIGRACPGSLHLFRTWCQRLPAVTGCVHAQARRATGLPAPGARRASSTLQQPPCQACAPQLFGYSGFVQA